MNKPNQTNQVIQAKKGEEAKKVQETAVVNPVPSLQRAYADPHTLTTADARTLQRTIGNRALGKLLIQRKMTPGPVGDKQEQEADAVAKEELLAHELTHTGQQGASAPIKTPKDAGAQLPSSPTVTRLGEQPRIQRAEADAVALANQLHAAGNYQTWADISGARDVVPAITGNWQAIATAYTAAGQEFVGTAALDIEAGRLMADIRSWADPQARREASNVLDQMVKMRTKLRADLKAVPDTAHKLALIAGIIGQIDTLEARINAIKTRFLMAHRAEGEGAETTHKWWGNKKRTVLDLPQGGKLELHNKINPATNREQGLGEGGLGYGRFGMMGGETKFVKKQKLKKNEMSAAAGVSTPLYEQPAGMQTQQIAWMEEEMNKFRHELDVTTNRLNHPNVIKTYGGAIGIGKRGAPKAYMVMDMMTGGDLKGVIAAGTATDTVKKEIMKGALDGLAHVHASGLIHRDIKPDNIMLDAAGVAKLIDFGEAVDMDAAGEYRTRTKAGTATYYHPTKIEGVPHGQDMIYDVSTDLYALQKTFQELAPANPALKAWISTFLAVNDAHQLSQNLSAIDIGDE